MNPNLAAAHFAHPDNPQDIDNLWQHYAWVQSLGVKWFSICLDDIGEGVDGRMHAKLVNEIFRRLRAKDPTAEMVFCPVYYWGNGAEDKKVRTYNDALARQLHPDVYLFWTGDQVIAPDVTRQSAETFKAVVKHRIILWDNYPCNTIPVLHLGPVTSRAADLCEVVDGYMSNPHYPQTEINRIPTLTCADYAYNPRMYDASRSIGQAILHLTETAAQRQVMKRLVETYPGNLAPGYWQSNQPVRERYLKLAGRRIRSRPPRPMSATSRRWLRVSSWRFPSSLGTPKAFWTRTSPG